MHRFELAQRIATLAAEIDGAKDDWVQFEKWEASDLVEIMYDLAVRLAGHRVHELNIERGWK